MNKLFLFPFILCFTLTLVSFKKSHGDLSTDLVFRYLHDVQKIYPLRLYAHGGSMMHDIQIVEVWLGGDYKFTKEEARTLFVELTEELLARYNRSEKIRPFLHNYPFVAGNVRLTLIFRDRQHKPPTGDFIASVMLGNDQQVVYLGYNEEHRSLYSMYNESYKEAFERVYKTNWPSDGRGTLLRTKPQRNPKARRTLYRLVTGARFDVSPRAAERHRIASRITCRIGDTSGAQAENALCLAE